MDGVIYTLLTGAVAYACLLFGEFVGIALRDLFAQPKSQDRDASSTSPSKEKSNGADFPKSYRRAVVLDCICIALACLFYVGALVAYFVGSGNWRPDVTFALLLGPPGALLRFVLAKLNPKRMFANRFPMGTFIANMLATGVLAASYVVQRTSYRTNLSITGCNAMIGIEQGFCGCLSTVSTFTVEAKSITSRLWKLIYVVSSVVLGHLLILAIVGGVKWSAEGLGPFCH
ncbi:hypothetical protein QFC21_000229 [Naganishia friedmannii]|uniref:Uncharacterized protein n=1 Tax=Naganishia friedmannii TaxID=89922 RepID=A0ACC2WAY7_9TREE|nr:hypothetical protein QFC21_000229 [Naganishia friedmannii]